MSNKKKNQSEYNEEELTKKFENSLGDEIENNGLIGDENEQGKEPKETPPIITLEQDKKPEPEVKKDETVKENKKPEPKAKKKEKKTDEPKKKVSELSASEYRFYMNTGFLPEK